MDRLTSRCDFERIRGGHNGGDDRDYATIRASGVGICLRPLHYMPRSPALWLDGYRARRSWILLKKSIPVVLTMLTRWLLTDASVIRVRIVLDLYRYSRLLDHSLGHPSYMTCCVPPSGLVDRVATVGSAPDACHSPNYNKWFAALLGGPVS